MTTSPKPTTSDQMKYGERAIALFPKPAKVNSGDDSAATLMVKWSGKVR
jgi:hypothetical protein